MSTLFILLTVLFIVISVALVLVILVQRPQGGGLASAFGGGGSTDTAFGGRTGDALTVATVAVFSVYLLLAIGLNVFNKKVDEVEPQAVIEARDPVSLPLPEPEQAPLTPATEADLPAMAPAAEPASPEPASPEPAAPEPAAEPLPEPVPEAATGHTVVAETRA